MVSNIGKITNLAATPSTGLVDGSDKLHSGILKVLESFSQGDMCISHAGFTITDGGTYTQYNLAQPIKFLKRGEFVNHTVTLTKAYTSSPVQNASHTRYDWVLINPATPELVIVQGTAASTPTVADITAGYIPIALVQVTAGTDDDKFDYSFQTFTLNVTKKSLSIMHGGNEAGNITGDTDSIDIASTITNADINLTPNGTGDVKLGTLKIDGDQTVGSGQDGYVLTYTHSNGKAALAEVAETITALNNQAANRLVTIGATTTELDGEANLTFDGEDLTIVSATNAKPKLTLENTTATASAATPPAIEFKRSGTPAQSGDLGMIKFVGKDSDDDSEHEYVRIFADMQDETETTEDGRLIFNIGRGSHQANSVSNTEMLRMSGGEGVIFNQPKNNVDFEIRGDTNDNLLFADAGNERIGILNGSPSATLDVTGSIAASTTITGADITGSASLTTQGLFHQVPETLDQTTSQPMMSGVNSIVYVFDISNAPSATPPGNSNVVVLPDPATCNHAVFTIRNVGSNTITIQVQGSQPIDGGLTTHALVSVANTITLPVGQHVTVQAVTDSVAPLLTGYYIIGN